VPHGCTDHITRVAWRPCWVPLYTSRMKSLLLLLVTLPACAAPQEETVKPPTSPTPPPAKPPPSGDVSVEIPVIEIKGTILEPAALDHPGMPLVDPKKPIRDKIGSEGWNKAVANQRTVVQSTKDPVAKQAQAAILATMLYRESKLRPSKAEEKTV